MKKPGEAGRTTVVQNNRIAQRPRPSAERDHEDMVQKERIARRVGRQRSARPRKGQDKRVARRVTRQRSANQTQMVKQERIARRVSLQRSANKTYAALGLIRFRLSISTKVVLFNPSKLAACFLFHLVRSKA